MISSLDSRMEHIASHLSRKKYMEASREWLATKKDIEQSTGFNGKFPEEFLELGSKMYYSAHNSYKKIESLVWYKDVPGNILKVLIDRILFFSYMNLYVEKLKMQNVGDLELADETNEILQKTYGNSPHLQEIFDSGKL